MTPEEHAHNTWVIIAANDGFFHPEYLERKIADAIRAAVEAEREACALIVDNHYPNGRASDLDTIAAAIRARE